jgi:uncharacterized Zn-binding protein involved in type VI secretion
MSLRTKIVAAGALALALAGAGTAIGGGDATGNGSVRSALRPLGLAGLRGTRMRGPGHRLGGPVVALQKASEYLGIPAATLGDELRSGKTLAQIADATDGRSASGLVDALVADAKTRLDEAVKAGRLTHDQADAFAGRLRLGIQSMVNGTRPALPFRPDGPGPNGPNGLPRPLLMGVQAAADYLGVTVDSLRADLRSGKTLAQVAQAQGKSVDGLVQALVAKAKAALADAVAAGRLTQAQADRVQTGLEQRIRDRVNGVRPPGFAPGGPGPRWGLPHGDGTNV